MKINKILFFFFVGCIFNTLLHDQCKAAFFLRKTQAIAIDIGHSKYDSGAISSRGRTEYSFNRDLAKLLYEKLLKNGYGKTFILNETGEKITLRKRVDIANNKNADLFVSIHHDSVQPKYMKKWFFQGEIYNYCDLYSGYSIFYSEKNTKSKNSLLFAKLLGAELRRAGFSPSLHHAEKIKGENRTLIDEKIGIYRVDDFGVIKSTKMPAIILECGIIVNRNDEMLLTNQDYKKALVASIVKAIDDYFSDSE